MTPLPANPASAFDESQLDHAAAQGRRDGLLGQKRDIALESLGAVLPAGPARIILEAALRQCYAAGHRHGSDVRRENAARRRRAEAPILSLLPGSAEAVGFRLIPGPGDGRKARGVQLTP